MTRTVTLVLAGSILAATSAEPAAAAVATPATTLSFNGTTYIHRWSDRAQNEYTPQGEEGLTAWKSMVTINVHDWVRNGDQLAELANRVLGNYQAAGKVLRTDSTPRTKDHEAEHFAAVLLGNPKFLEAAFARVVLVEGRGVVIVYSKRFYGAAVGNEMSAWMAKNGEPFEKALRSWTGMPSLAALNALPQAKPAERLAFPRDEAIARLKSLDYADPTNADHFVGAAIIGKGGVVELFLAAGMPVDTPNGYGQRALQMSIRGGFIEVAEVLLKAGADPRLSDQNGETPLIELAMYCAETPLFAAMLAKGVDVNARSRSGETALKVATFHGCKEMVRLLKKAGAVR